MSFLSNLFGPPVPTLTPTELSEKLKFGKRPLILDVRQPDEFRRGHINGAKLIPLNELRRRMDELSKGREIVCICESGSRSKSAAKALIKAGYAAFDVPGGMGAWKHAKLPVTK